MKNQQLTHIRTESGPSKHTIEGVDFIFCYGVLQLLFCCFIFTVLIWNWFIICLKLFSLFYFWHIFLKLFQNGGKDSEVSGFICVIYMYVCQSYIWSDIFIRLTKSSLWTLRNNPEIGPRSGQQKRGGLRLGCVLWFNFSLSQGWDFLTPNN